jgi:[ribosomal protein S5]-alanine N-acetyltransferase
MIRTERLNLVSLPMQFLLASREGDRTRACEVLGCSLGEEWQINQHVLEARIPQLQADPSIQEWLLRAMILRGENLMVGHLGFHTRPSPGYLAEWCPTGVELGFTVFASHRRRGFAREAAGGLMGWASTTHGVRHFVATVAPGNVPSRRLVEQLGFLRVGTHVDEVDGPEDILVMDCLNPGEASPA